MTPAERRLKDAVLDLIAEGRYPGTPTVCRRLGFHRARPDLNGREMVWRREVLTGLGWREVPNGARSWAPP